MPLTVAQIRAALPREKAYRLYDQRGIYLEVQPNGGRYWRLKYRFEGKEKRISLGVYPETSLATARKKCDEARSLLASGIEPSAHRKAQKIARAGAETFEVIAREWFEGQAKVWAPSHSDKVIGRLEREIFPWLGSKAIQDITAPLILERLRAIEDRGYNETAHRTLQVVSRVFRYAIATGRAFQNPGADLKGALKPVDSQPLASITDPREVGALMRAVSGYNGEFPTVCALKLAPLLFVRPGELRKSRWSEFDLEKAECRIPAKRMKKKVTHLVPLATQAVEILNALFPLTGRYEYLFPGARDTNRPMSENTITAALRRLGYASGEMTGHGFRAMASTLLNERGWNPDAIERQLAHLERNKVRAAYNYAEHLPERRQMMQAWADYLDELREGTAS